MKCLNIKLWIILGCFHYILNVPRMSTLIQNPTYMYMYKTSHKLGIAFAVSLISLFLFFHLCHNVRVYVTVFVSACVREQERPLRDCADV